MYISFKESSAKGFKRWSDAHPSAGNDNDGDLPNGVAVSMSRPKIDYAVTTSRPRDLWLVPGMARTL